MCTPISGNQRLKELYKLYLTPFIIVNCKLLSYVEKQLNKHDKCALRMYRMDKIVPYSVYSQLENKALQTVE